METVLTVAGIAALFVLNAVIFTALSWLLTEKIKISPKVKPLNCWGCMAFWLTFIFGIGLAVAVVEIQTGLTGTAGAYARWFLYGWAFLSGIIAYQNVNSKYKINE